MNIKVTFKKHPKETGLRAIGYSGQSVDIKFKKKVIGLIDAPCWHTKDNLWGLFIKVKTTERSCGWKSITCKGRFATEEAARVAAPIFIQAMINKGYELYLDED